MPIPLLTVENLSISFSTYAGTLHALRNLSFTVEEGETLALVGESGCGKSVTAHAIMGLLPQPPGKIESGEILFAGNTLLYSSQRKHRKEIGMVFQDPMTSLNPTMRIGKQITEAILTHHRLSAYDATQQMLQLLQTVGISHPIERAHQYPHEFSGGMRQRVMIAIALSCHPKLLIADEPTTALDVTIQAQILELLRTLQQKHGTSIIFITHDLGVVAEMSDRVAVMYGGKIVEMAPVTQLFEKPSHPYTQGLLQSIPRIDREPTHELSSIPGSPPTLLSLPSGCAFYPRCPNAMRICTKYSPPLEALSSHHRSACWLHHPQCNKGRPFP
jgi:oligopeptide transport system ATP-binding protein